MANGTTDSPRFFAASNSGCGFVSYFDKVFSRDRFDRVYILKGGPGTGKSSLMKSAEKYAVSQGYKCEVVLCSSDISSYDGVIISGGHRRIAIIDGTSPHTADTQLPGAVDEIINLGSFWHPEKLSEKREQISALIKSKSKCYSCAYAMLRGAESYAKEKRSILYECIDREKLMQAAGRLLLSADAEKSITAPEYKLKNAISSDGCTGTDIYSHEDGTHYAVSGVHGASFAFFDALADIAKSKRLPLTLSPSPLSPSILDAMAIPSAKMYFCSVGDSDADIYHKVINTERFLIESRLRDIKPTLRALSRLEKSATEASVKMLEKAKGYHFALEDIYVSAMDFEKKEQIQEKLIKSII